METEFTGIENEVYRLSGKPLISTAIPYLKVANFPQLGLITSLRFLEWVLANPEGVISLPTGKTPEYFIKFTKYLLDNWNSNKGEEIRERYGLSGDKAPSMKGLRFVQIDEFYPIDTQQHNSFHNYVMKYYIDGFGLDVKRCMLISSNRIPLAGGRHFSTVFPENYIDLSLRNREAKTASERIAKDSIYMVDEWCNNYEQAIREMGGIGFFLGGIGPDGHIAFNTRGTDHFSTTRLTPTNFETQAVSATDLGGIEISKNRLVITVGLDTITYNKEATAIIFAAGEAKAEIVARSLESEASILYPATVLHKLKGARFYLTNGAASALSDSKRRYYSDGEWTQEKTDRAVIDLCGRINKYGHHITVDDLKADEWCSMIPGISDKTVAGVVESIRAKLAYGMVKEKGEIFYHTGPHHDDIMLGMMPHINRQMREVTNEFRFAICTSGFTAVSNSFITELLNKTLLLMESGEIEMLKYPDFFDSGYKLKWDKDVYHYLDNVAGRNDHEMERGFCHRIVRALVEIWEVKSVEELQSLIINTIEEINASYEGSIDSARIQNLKGMIREFEEELVWAHYGVRVENLSHLRLGFYKGALFTEQPDRSRDVAPLLDELRRFKPTVVSLALDPEGSGPDTHYKVLQTIAAALSEWAKEEDLSGLRVIGYRNVWYRFHPAESDIIIPVSLNSLAILEDSFATCYLSQVNASFPSPEMDGRFSSLTRKIWVEQLRQIQLLLGKNFFYQNQNKLLRATHGLIYLKEMKLDQFLLHARDLEKSIEGII